MWSTEVYLCMVHVTMNLQRLFWNLFMGGASMGVIMSRDRKNIICLSLDMDHIMLVMRLDIIISYYIL